MAILRFGNEWTKQNTFKSILLFFVHFVVLVLVMAVLILGMQLNNFVEHMKQFGASYLYALFCVLLLVVIMYLYLLKGFDEEGIFISSHQESCRLVQDNGEKLML